MLRQLLLSAFIAAPLFAGPVRPIMAPDFAPAAYSQSSVDVATNGRDFVAVWMDERMKDRPNFSRGLAIYATRLSADGQALDPFGIGELSPQNAYGPLLESTGRAYLLAYNTNEGAWTVRLNNDARPENAAQMISSRPVEELATDGTTYCALIAAGQSRSAALLLDENGALLRSIPIDGWASSVVAVSGNYVVITVHEGEVRATTINRDGSVTAKVVVAEVPALAFARAYSNGRRAIVAWFAQDQKREWIEYAVLDENGARVASVRRVSEREKVSYSYDAPSLAWDGGSFVLVWHDVNDNTRRGVRVASNARLLDTEPVVIADPIERFRAAHNGFRTVLVSSESLSAASDPVTRVLTSFQLHDLPEPHVIAFSATPHSEPDVAATGTVAMAVAREGESYGSITGSIFAPSAVGNEQRVVLAPPQPFVYQDGPSVAAAGDLFLVVWRETRDYHSRILARRVAANGAVLDSQPIVIAEEGRTPAVFAETDVAFDGEAFLVVWPSFNEEIRARRLRRDGTFLGPSVQVSRHVESNNRERRTPAVVWNGSGYFVAWSEMIPLSGAAITVYRAARVARDGTVLDAEESLVLFDHDGHTQGIALAMGKDRVLLTTITGAYTATAPWPVHTLLFDAAGHPLADAPSRIDNGDEPGMRRMHPAAAWNGSSFLIFWNERENDYSSALTARRMNADGTIAGVLDVGNATTFFPAAAMIDGGVLLVETASRPEQSNVARLFARTFLGSLTKTRSARH
ncbi:MAG TPA: hypothetical protein VF883_00995 [Thermoanaerobaculia bacterium]|jgi:hypothetical protein